MSQDDKVREVLPVHSGLLNTNQAAEYLGVSRRFLEIGRMSGRGPRFVKISNKVIRYQKKSLDLFVEQRVRTSTSDDGSAA